MPFYKRKLKARLPSQPTQSVLGACRLHSRMRKNRTLGAPTVPGREHTTTNTTTRPTVSMGHGEPSLQVSIRKASLDLESTRWGKNEPIANRPEWAGSTTHMQSRGRLGKTERWTGQSAAQNQRGGTYSSFYTQPYNNPQTQNCSCCLRSRHI